MKKNRYLYILKSDVVFINPKELADDYSDYIEIPICVNDIVSIQRENSFSFPCTRILLDRNEDKYHYYQEFLIKADIKDFMKAICFFGKMRKEVHYVFDLEEARKRYTSIKENK